MKILSLRFNNINSLAGEWSIHFTEPRFTDYGIFAITGKTGAGKSSILDAISLALYGKTPRVDITGQNNEVMTRGTKDCYAEIVFETGGKKWVSSWKQERARTGNLKPVTRSIADAKGEIVADQIGECNKKMEEILGLTFPQFTKVILLAQGSFAAFLDAKPNDKGELLEQITGTEIYGEISIKVFERNRIEKEKLEKIKIELESIKILPDDDIVRLKNEITEFENQKKIIDSDLQSAETAKKWVNDLSNLQQQINEAKTKLPELERKSQEATVAFEQSVAAYASIKSEQEKAAPIWVKVRELDTQMAEKEKLLKPLLLTISNLSSLKNELSQKLENQKSDFKKSQAMLVQSQEWATAHAKQEQLVGNFAAIENQHAQVMALRKDFEVKSSEWKAKKKRWEETNLCFLKAKTSLAEKEKGLIEKEQELEVKKRGLSLLLSGKELAEYHIEKEKITAFGMQVKNLIDTVKEISKNVTEIDNYEKSLVTLKQSENKLSEMILENKKNLEALEEKIISLEERIKLVSVVQNLEAHRKLLKDGEKCPLCGALEHPYAQGNIPQLGEEESELAKQKKQFQEVTNGVLQNEKELARLISNSENALKNKQKEESNRFENQQKQKTILAEIKMVHADFCLPDVENKIAFLEELRIKKLNDFKEINEKISKAIEIERCVKKLQNEEIPQLQKDKQMAEKAKTEAETALKLTEQQVESKQAFLKDVEQKFKEKQDELLQQFAEYGVDNIETLQKSLSDWNSNKQKMIELKEQLVKIEKDVALTESEQTYNQNQLMSKEEEKLVFEKEKQALFSERSFLFGEKLVSEEEKRLIELLEMADNAKTNAEKEKNDAETEIAKNRAIIAEKVNELKEKQEQKMTQKTMEELQGELDEKRLQSDTLSQKIGANRQTLYIHADNLKNFDKILKNKESQQKICQRWGCLNELIGSSDGKKYRNFAQALTFDHLIGFANRQLQKMSERYLLKQVNDPANPFELSVIDKFQNCEERTAKNLSGGEKFIVSLSLALGLANMASRNINIDTMFIDEGFGTLDSEYLDVALTALSNLQNEGKLIGVISHLSELKERITTHIEVISNSNGLSRIEFDKNPIFAAH